MSHGKKDYTRLGSDWLPPGAAAPPASRAPHWDDDKQNVPHIQKSPVKEEVPQTPSSLSIVLWVTLGVVLVTYPSLFVIFFVLTFAIGFYIVITDIITSVLKKLF